MAKADRSEKRNGGITLQRLRIFWAVAHSETMTKAAKQLGLTQPTLSQQISGLETTVGTPLFERRSNQMILTEAGNFFLRKAEQVLKGMDELEDGLAEFGEGVHVTIRIAGLSSMLRLVLPEAAARVQSTHPNVEYDIHDCAPQDVLEMLYGRRATVGLVNASTVGRTGNAFAEIPLFEDPYVLAVPQEIDMEGIVDPVSQLPAAERDILNRSIRFSFGSKHTQRVQDWYDQVLPENRTVASTRRYEDALALVQAGLGVCLAPVLACMTEGSQPQGVNLYRVTFPPRRIVALVPTQYRRIEPYACLLDALRDVAGALRLPALKDTPPALRRAGSAGIE